MKLSTLWFCFLLLFGIQAHSKGVADDRTPQHPTRDSHTRGADDSLDAGRLLIGEPLVGVVEQGESQLVHFGVLPRKEKFPDILIHLDAVDSHARVDVYCSPQKRTHTEFPPDRVTASWQTTKNGEMFISSKNVHYQSAIVEKHADGDTVQVAEFSCAIHAIEGGTTKFQLTLQVSFDQRELHPEQQMVMKEIFKECCAEDKSCHRWLFKEQEANGGKGSLGNNIEFDFCHRTGSICNAQGDLVRLDLRAYDLKCKLPVKSLLKLTTLESLDLSDNKIHADITEEVVKLGGLRRLSDLALANNFIFGEMSSSSICSKLLKKLRMIDLDDNFMTGRLPTCIYSDIPMLEELYLSRNHFSGYISDLFSSISSLKALTLSGNELTGMLPSSLGRIKTLRVLYLDGNSFNGQIPESFSFMRSLEILDLSNNRLSSFPSTWSSTWDPPKALRVVKLQNNKLRGEMPERLLRAQALEWLDMSSNSISGHLFARTEMFPRMTHFNMSRNELTGSIPEEFVSLGVFGNAHRTGPRHVFDVSFNKLAGHVPEFMYQEATPSIIETEIYLEGNSFRCHHWKTLNYVPNFECNTHHRSGGQATSSVPMLLESEGHQRELIASLNGARTASSNSEYGSSPNSSGGNEAADAIVGIVSAVLGVLIVAGIVVLVVKFKKSRDRRMGLQYGAADEADSDDGLKDTVPNGNPGPSHEPQDETSTEHAEP